MTLNVKDINSAATGSFTYNHFSRISVLQDTFKVEGQKRQKLFLKQKVNKVYDVSRKCYTNHSGRDWNDEVGLEENRGIANLLNTENDSVLDYSILSERANIDSELQLFTPSVVGGDCSFDLSELNAQMALLLVEYFPGALPSANFLTRLTLSIIPQTVQLNQALGRYDNNGSSSKNIAKFLQTCNRLLTELWVPSLSESIRNMKSAIQILENFEGKFNKVELKGAFETEVGSIIRRWSLLNYFPVVLIKSLNFKIERNLDDTVTTNDCNMISSSELFKISFITLAIEVSRGLQRLISIFIDLKASNAFSNRSLICVLELLLECTVDSRAAEIMIGLDQVIKKWILFRETTDGSTRRIFHQWCQQILNSYKIQKQQEYELKNAEDEDEADLMFDKREVGKMFINEILQFIEPKASTRTRSNPFGWLTVFDEYYNENWSASNSGAQEPFDFDTVSIQTISEPPRRPLGRRAALKRWAMSKRQQVSEGCRRMKRRFQQAFHVHTTRALITSVRYYNAINGRKYERHFPDETSDFTPDQCAQMQRLTQKLYKREKKGKRKRDAIRVIFM